MPLVGRHDHCAGTLLVRRIQIDMVCNQIPQDLSGSWDRGRYDQSGVALCRRSVHIRAMLDEKFYLAEIGQRAHERSVAGLVGSIHIRAVSK